MTPSDDEWRVPPGCQYPLGGFFPVQNPKALLYGISAASFSAKGIRTQRAPGIGGCFRHRVKRKQLECLLGSVLHGRAQGAPA
jgi:hypothetical protein